MIKKNKKTHSEKSNKNRVLVSNSQRRGISNLAMIFGSKKFIIFVSIVLIISGLIGFLIIQKTKDSKAYTITRTEAWSVSSHNGFGSSVINGVGWSYDHEGIPAVATNNSGQNLRIGFPAGVSFRQGLHACWIMSVPADVTVSQVKFNLTGNMAGSSEVYVRRNAEILNTSNSNGGIINRAVNNELFQANVTPSQGGTISVCHRVAGAGGTTVFNASNIADSSKQRFVYVNDYAIFGDRTYQQEVGNPLFYEVADQQLPPSTMTVGDSPAMVVLKIKNIGTNSWKSYSSGDPNPVNLATTNSSDTSGTSGRDRASVLHNETDGYWIGRNRVRMQESTVDPGQVGTFMFTVVPRSQGTYDEYFTLVKEGSAWFPARGIHFRITVNPKPVITDTSGVCSGITDVVDSSAEAEKLVCGPNNKPKTQDDTQASASKRVLLSSGGQYVTTKFKVSLAGTYRAGAIVKSIDYNGSAVARITIAKVNSAGNTILSQNEDRTAPSSGYDRRFMTQTGKYIQLTDQEVSSGVKLSVNITFTNDSYNASTGEDRNLLVDTLYVEKMDSGSSGNNGSTCNSNISMTGVLSRQQAQNSTNRSAFTSATAQVISGNTDQRVANADGCNAVDILSNNVYIESKFTVSQTGKFSLFARARSDVVKSGNYADGFARVKATISYNKPAKNGENGQNIKEVAFPGYYDTKAVGSSFQLNAGTEVTVRLTYINDYFVKNSNGVITADRNLWMDFIEIHSEGSVDPQTTSNCTNNSTTQTLDVEAENAVCGPATNAPNTQDDGLASGGKRVLLSSDGQYAEYVFKPKTAGTYTGGGIVKSLDYKGSATARITLTKLSVGLASVSTTEDRSAPANVYDRRFVTTSGKQLYIDSASILSGVSIRVRVTFSNDLRDSGGDRNLLVDKLYVENILPSGEGEICKDNTPDSTRTTEAESAEKGPSTNKPGSYPDSNAIGGGKMTALLSNNQFVQTTFTIDKCDAGKYTPSVRIRGEQYPKNTLPKVELTMIANGKSTSKTYEVGIDYEEISFKDSADALDLKAGQTVTVRAKFVNDSYKPPLKVNNRYDDRNLFVDSISILKFGAYKPISNIENDSTVKSSPVQSNQPSNYEFRNGWIQGEDALRYGYATSSSDTKNSVTSGVLLRNRDKLSHTFNNVSIDDLSTIDINARSDVTQDKKRAKVRVTVTALSNNKYSRESVILDLGKEDDPTLYETSRIQISDVVSVPVSTNAKINVLITFLNDSYKNGDRNAWIDYFGINLRPVSYTSNGSSFGAKSTSLLSDTFSARVIEAQENTACELRSQYFNCQEDVSPAIIINDSIASEGSSVSLRDSGDSIIKNVFVKDSGNYSVGFRLKSKSYRGLAKAKIELVDVGGDSETVVATKEFTTPDDKYELFKLDNVYLEVDKSYRLSVTYLNDLCGYNFIGINFQPCDDNNDRNLLVDQMYSDYFYKNGSVNSVKPVQTERSLVDRPDENSNPKIHIYYVVPSDVPDYKMDTNGYIEDYITKAQAWMRDKSVGREFVFDTKDGKLDITYVKLPKTEAEVLSMLNSKGTFEMLHYLMKYFDDNFPRTDGPKIRLMMQQSPSGIDYCGVASSSQFTKINYALTFVFPGVCGSDYRNVPNPKSMLKYNDSALVHEILHAMGYTLENNAKCAPNSGYNGVNENPSGGHSKIKNDIMSYLFDKDYRDLDINHTDYYLVKTPGCYTGNDLSKSPFLTP